MRVLVTGATGFAGSFLLEHLIRQNGGNTLFALARRRTALPEVAAGVQWLVGDLTDAGGAGAVMARAAPQGGYHLPGPAPGAAEGRGLASPQNVDAELQPLG